MENLLHTSNWTEALALYGGSFCVGGMFAGIVFGLDHLANTAGLKK